MTTRKSAAPQGASMPCTSRVNAIVHMAREEALRLHCDRVETEHELLALVREGEGIGATVLTNLGFDFGQIRHEIENRSTCASSTTPPIETIRFSTQAQRILLVLAPEEATAWDTTTWAPSMSCSRSCATKSASRRRSSLPSGSPFLGPDTK